MYTSAPLIPNHSAQPAAILNRSHQVQPNDALDGQSRYGNLVFPAGIPVDIKAKLDQNSPGLVAKLVAGPTSLTDLRILGEKVIKSANSLSTLPDPTDRFDLVIQFKENPQKLVIPPGPILFQRTERDLKLTLLLPFPRGKKPPSTEATSSRTLAPDSEIKPHPAKLILRDAPVEVQDSVIRWICNRDEDATRMMVSSSVWTFFWITSLTGELNGTIGKTNSGLSGSPC